MQSSQAGAQSNPAASSDWLTVSGQESCLQVAALVAHTKRYLVERGPTGQVQIEVRVEGGGAVTFTVRGPVHSAQRHFPRLPRRCPDRLRALGLAMALAIESVGAGRVAESVLPDGEGGVGRGGDDASRGAPPGASEAGPIAPGPDGGQEPDGARERAARSAAEAAPGAADGLAQAPGGDRPTGDRADPETGEPDVEAVTGGQPPRSSSFGGASIWAGAGLIAGVKPGLAFAAALGADLRFGSFGLGLGALWSPRSAETVSEDAGAQTSLYGGRASACLGGTLSIARAEGCLGVMGGALVAEGTGVDRSERVTVGWLASTVGLRLRVPAATALGFRVGLDFQQNLVQPALVVAGGGGGSVLAGDFGVSGFAGLEIAFP